MREITDMCARPHDDLAVSIQERVGLAHERCDLDGEAAFEAFGTTRANGSQALRDAVKRRKAVADLEGGDQEQNESEHGEGNEQCAVEVARLLIDLGRVTRNRDQKPPLLAEINGSFQKPEPLVFRPLHIILAGAARTRSDAAIL